LFVVSANNIFAQEPNQKDSIKEKVPLFKDFRVDVDISPIFTTLLSGGETYSLEGALQTTLLNKYYPIVEAGLAGANKTSLEDINFVTNGFFLRAGTDFNVLKQKNMNKKFTNYFFVGARIGFSTFGYSINNIILTDDYWNETKTYNFDNQISAKVWMEIVASIRVEIVKNIYLGWSIRNKNLLNPDSEGKISPWYIPGFGKNDTSAWGVNYVLGYKF